MVRLGVIRLLLAAACVCVSTASGATFFPYLNPLRAEIISQLALLTDGTNTPSAVELRTLTQARNTLDRRGRATLAGDLQKLTTLAALLSRSTNGVVYEPLLEEAIENYYDRMLLISDQIASTLAAMPPSQQVITAQNTLDQVNDTLADALAAETAVDSGRLLNRAALRLLAVQTMTTRVTRERSRAEELTAFVGSTTFRATGTTSAFYNAGAGSLTVSGSQTVSGENRSLTLTFLDVRPGTTSHQLGSVTTGTYGVFSRTGTNTISYMSASGSAIVTLDTNAQTVSGTFSFRGTTPGGFEPPVQVSGGSFFSRLR